MWAHVIDYAGWGQFSSCDTFEKTPGALQSVSHRLSWDWPLFECFNYLQASRQDGSPRLHQASHTFTQFFPSNMRVSSCFFHKSQAQSVPTTVTLPGDQAPRAQCCLRLTNTHSHRQWAGKVLSHLIIVFSTSHKSLFGIPIQTQGPILQVYRENEKSDSSFTAQYFLVSL